MISYITLFHDIKKSQASKTNAWLSNQYNCSNVSTVQLSRSVLLQEVNYLFFMRKMK